MAPRGALIDDRAGAVTLYPNCRSSGGILQPFASLRYHNGVAV